MTRFLWLAAILAVGSPVQAVEFKEVLNYVPGHLNTVAVINVRDINKTPRAVKEEWAKNHETEYLAGALAVPAWADFVILGAELYPGMLAEGKTLALVPVSDDLNTTMIAQREGGTTQLMGERTVILSPRRGYVAMPRPGVVAVSSTLPRQEYAKWLNQPKPEKPSISPYIQQALAAKAKSNITVVMDLSEIFDPQGLRLELLRGGIAKEDPSLEALVQGLAYLKGAVVSIQIDDPSPTEIQLDFSRLSETQSKAITSNLQKLIDLCGFEISELKKATVTTGDKTITLKTAFGDSSLRRLLSVINAPADAAKSSEGGNILMPKDSAALASSMRYYRAVNTLLEDLRNTKVANKPNEYANSALWYETYANKIDKLSIQYVDPELVQYASSTSGKLRALAGSLRGLKVQLDAYDSYKSVTTAGSVGGFSNRRGSFAIPGDVQMDSNVSALSTKQAELVAQMAPERVKVWQVIDADRSSVRRNMLEKYKIDFENLKK